jgi:hypothetical protein
VLGELARVRVQLAVAAVLGGVQRHPRDLRRSARTFAVAPR